VEIHRGAGAAGDDDGKFAGEDVGGEAGDLARGGPVAGIEGRLAAAGLVFWEFHGEAEVLEHALSDRLLDAIDAQLGHPTRDPHGDLIPAADGTLHRPDAVRLDAAPAGFAGRVVRIIGVAHDATDRHRNHLRTDAFGLHPERRRGIGARHLRLHRASH
jgi:hypothetical protein